MVGRVCPRHGHRGRPLNSAVRHQLNTVFAGVVRGAVTLAVALVAGGVAEEIAVAVFVRWYMHAHNVAVRADLAEDYGFGMFGFVVSAVVFITFAVLGGVLAWKISGRGSLHHADRSQLVRADRETAWAASGRGTVVVAGRSTKPLGVMES